MTVTHSKKARAGALLALLGMELAAGPATGHPAVGAAVSATSSNDAAAALALGRELRRAGQSADAVRELRRATALAGARGGEVGILLRWELARTFIERREFAPAMESCRAVGRIPGGEAAGHACEAEAHLLLKRGSLALESAGRALADHGHLYEAKVAEGLAYELLVNEPSAESSFREAIAWRPEAPEAHAWLGRLLVRESKRDEGVGELRRAVDLDPNDAESNYELALVLPAGPDAEALLQRAVRARPSYALGFLQLANVKLELGKMAEARAAAEAALKYDANEPAAYLAAGRAALAEGRADDAIRAGQSALALAANSARSKLLIADGYAKKGEVDLAIESYEGAFGLDRSDPTPLVRAGEACLHEGRDTSARAFGAKATREFPQWGPAWVVYGDALAAENEPALAREAYEMALKAAGPLDPGGIAKKLSALR